MAPADTKLSRQRPRHDHRILDAADYLLDVRARLRAALPQEAFGDPVFDLLLPLVRAGLHGEDMSVGKLVATSGVPHATMIRWIDHLERSGGVRRLSDSDNGRRKLVEATATVSEAISRCLLDAKEARTAASDEEQQSAV